MKIETLKAYLLDQLLADAEGRSPLSGYSNYDIDFVNARFEYINKVLADFKAIEKANSPLVPINIAKE